MDEPLRIVTPVHSPRSGGVERVALRLAREWQRLGHDSVVVLGRADEAEHEDLSGLDVWHIRSRHNPASYETPWMIHSLASCLLEQRADAVFCPGNTYAVVGAVIQAMFGESCPPLLLKVSNALHRPDMGPAMRWGYGHWLHLQGRIFDRIVGLSEPMRQEIRLAMEPASQRVSIIPNPIFAQERLSALMSILRPMPSAWSRRYLSVGRLCRQKNYALLLRAFARGAREGDTLTIAGEGPDRAHLERLSGELRIGHRVSFPGAINPIDPLLAESDVLVLSSDYEGLPAVVVEALAAGMPIIATNCCVSMPELLDGGRLGRLVPVGDEAALAEAIREADGIQPDPAQARRIAARYQVESAAAAYVSLMRQTICEARLARRARDDSRCRMAGYSLRAHRY